MRARSQHARTSPAWARTVAATSFGLIDPGAADDSAGAVAAGAKEDVLLGAGDRGMQIVREAGKSDYRLSAIVMEIVKSAPFQMNRKGL